MFKFNHSKSSGSKRPLAKITLPFQGRITAEIPSSSCCKCREQLLPPSPYSSLQEAWSLPFLPSQQTDAFLPPGAQPSSWQPWTTAVGLSVLFLICCSEAMVVLVAFHMIWNTLCIRYRRALPRMLFPYLQKPLWLNLSSPRPHLPGWPCSLITLRDSASWLSGLSKESPRNKDLGLRAS